MQLKELGVLWGVVAGVAGLSAFLAHGTAPATTPVAIVSPPTALPARPLIRASELLEHANPRRLGLRSDVALVFDESDSVPLYERNSDTPRPIASLTKLMTALVVLEAKLPLAEEITVTHEDRDRLRGSRSRLPFKTTLTRQDLLLAALAASDNRAAAALARTYPGGTSAFIRAMNQTAQRLGMTRSRFADAAGLDSGNISTARDLVKLVTALDAHPLIAQLSTHERFDLTDPHSGRRLTFVNTNRFVRGDRWDIALSKTGYTADAGNCLVMRANVGDRPLTIVLLNSWGKHSKYGDSVRIRDWLLQSERAARKTNATLVKTSL
ncbi:MAG: serine hydrolase [Gammaproteobacteria bacterium]